MTPFQWYAFATLDRDFQSAMQFQNHYQWHAFRALGMEFDKAVQVQTPEMISQELESQAQKRVPFGTLVPCRLIDPDAGGDAAKIDPDAGGDAAKIDPPQPEAAGGVTIEEDAS